MKRKKRKIEKRGNENWFNRNYKLSWNYLKEIKSFLLFSLVLMLFGGLVGYFYPVFFHDFIRKFIEDLIRQTDGFNTSQMIFFILKNNLSSSLYSLIFGVVLGIFPIISALFNGYVIGYVVKQTSAAVGLSVLWNLVPHGIFEIPAIILSIGMGIRLGSFLFVKNKKSRFLYDFENSLRVFVFVIIPLLIVAAIIEGILVMI